MNTVQVVNTKTDEVVVSITDYGKDIKGIAKTSEYAVYVDGKKLVRGSGDER